MEPLPPRRKWQAITLATLVLAPALWSLLAGLVAVASDDDAGGAPNAGAAIAFGLAVIPFAFIVLAFVSQHPRAPGAVARAMGLFLLVGVPVSALAADAITGIVAGLGAGGVVALRADAGHTWRSRALAVVVASVYVFVLVRVAAVLALLPAPVFPFTAVGMADHLVERRAEREGRRTEEP
ncbi:MAG TPA: hypothetical protein VHK88_14030 [Aquihabitans sp.]|jgi:hypothetical protein|nr:hypothetical protein [Aquihabitans sp.]